MFVAVESQKLLFYLEHLIKYTYPSSNLWIAFTLWGSPKLSLIIYTTVPSLRNNKLGVHVFEGTQ